MAAPCASAPDACRALRWVVSSSPRCRPGSLPRSAGATAGRGPCVSGRADGVCAAWRGPSRAVSHLRAAVGVHRGPPAGRGAATCAGWGACSVRSTPQGDPDQGCGVPGVSPVGAGGGLWGGCGSPQGMGHAHPCRRAGCLWGPQAGWRREKPGILSIACQGDTSSEQVGTRSVQPGVEASPGRPRSEARTWFGGGQAQLNS